MKEIACFYFEGMALALSEATWVQSGNQIPDWTLHFLIDVLTEGFSVVGISTKTSESSHSKAQMPFLMTAVE